MAGDAHNLGFMYEHGSGVKQSDFEAVKYYRKACTLEEGAGCFNLGRYVSKRPQRRKAERF